MTAQEAVNKLAEHLLGKNWHSDCIYQENINEDININTPRPFCGLFELRKGENND